MAVPAPLPAGTLPPAPEEVKCFGISPIEREKLGGWRRTGEEGVVQESRPRQNHAENPSLTVLAQVVPVDPGSAPLASRRWIS